MSTQRKIEICLFGGFAIALLAALLGFCLRQLSSEAEMLAYATGAGAIGALIETSVSIQQ